MTGFRYHEDAFVAAAYDWSTQIGFVVHRPAHRDCGFDCALSRQGSRCSTQRDRVDRPITAQPFAGRRALLGELQSTASCKGHSFSALSRQR